MKVFLLALFVVAAVAAPAPLDEEIGEPVELIVNGIVEGEPLELGDVLDIKVKEHVNGEVASATNLLHPFTAVGLAEAAAAAVVESEVPTDSVPEIIEVDAESVVLPAPVLPGLILPSEPATLPDPVLPVVIPEPVVLPEPVAPEVVVPVAPVEVLEPVVEEPAEFIPIPAPQGPTGEIFNDGIVQVTVNAPEAGVLSTVQSWFNMVLNYFNGGVQTTHQIV